MSDKHTATALFFQRVNLSLTLRVKISGITAGDGMALWQVAQDAGYDVAYADFLAACRTVNLHTLCAELVHVIEPLQDRQ